MIEKISKLNNEFNKSFPEVYLKPSKVNKFLRKYSNEVERKIKKRFLDLDLDKNFVIYANGGFGRKEIFPISDIDISIVEKNKPKDLINNWMFANSIHMIDYINIATLGNSVRFGELARTNSGASTANNGPGVSSPTRAFYCGGYGSPAPVYTVNNTMEFVQIMTEGNSVDFGDLVQKVKAPAGMSNGHGGL